MELNKYILAVITTNQEKVAAGTGVFYCKDTAEMETLGASLEAILDGIAHALSEELLIIVRH